MYQYVNAFKILTFDIFHEDNMAENENEKWSHDKVLDFSNK